MDYVLSLPSEMCPVFGTQLEWGTGTDLAGSLDRFKPENGYTKGNVCWISWRANSIKRDASLDEIKSIYDWMQYVQQVS